MSHAGNLKEIDAYLESILSRGAIFKDRDALRHDFVPSQLPHRENELRRLGEVLAPILRSSKASNALLYGKTGTGKTACVRLISKLMKDKAKERSIPFIETYVNCRIEGTVYRVLAEVAGALGTQVPFTGLATGEVLSRLVAALKKQPTNLLMVLDEVDVLVKEAGDDLLYELSRIGEYVPDSKVTMVVISNDLSFKDYLDPRVLSTLNEEEIIFPPYTADQLREILQVRSHIAFNDGVAPPAVIGLVSALSASEHGDARRALNLLRVAGEIAERRNASSITAEDVQVAVRKIEEDHVFEVCRSLPLHSKILLACVTLGSQKEAFPTSGEIYSEYVKQSASLGVPDLTYRRMAMLLNELEMLGVVRSKIVNMGRHGRTRKLRLAVPSEPVLRALRADSMIVKLLEPAR